MIPYISIKSLPLFDAVAIHPFGVLVATGILIGSQVTIRHGRRLALLSDNVRNMIFWILLAGFGFSHIFDIAIYQDSTLMQKLEALVDPRTGLSSMGGFIGALGGLWAWCWRKDRREMLAYADSLAFGLAPGWALGRLGCTVAHDHPGIMTDFILGVDYPCPRAFCPPITDWFYTNPVFRRHDAALYEVIFALILTIVFFCARPFKPRKGFYLLMAMICYAPIRFMLDFIRIKNLHGADPRYYGLTPAQYCAVLIILVVPLVYRRVLKKDLIEYPSF